MKYILFALALSTFAFSSYAEEGGKPFTEMTYVELQQVESSSLDKATLKTYKKALKAARRSWEKAERKRVKAEKKAEKERLKAIRKAEKAKKKAEKKRLKAEKKRQRAIEKAHKKHARAIRKKLRPVMDAHSEASIVHDPFEASINIEGARGTHYDYSLINEFGTGGRLLYSLRSFYFTNENKLVLKAIITVKFQEEIDSVALEALHLTPYQFATKHGFWKQFNSAKLMGGKVRRIEPTSREDGYCYGICTFYEEYTIDLELDDLVASIRDNSALAIKLSSRKTRPVIVEIPKDYIVGYLWRVSEVDERLLPLGDAAKQFVARIRSTPVPPIK